MNDSPKIKKQLGHNRMKLCPEYPCHPSGILLCFCRGQGGVFTFSPVPGCYMLTVSPVSFVPCMYSRKKAELLPAALGRINRF